MKQRLSLLLPAIILFALVLRLPLLSGSFWLDEAAQAIESSRAFNQQLQIAGDFQPPLLHFITHFALGFSKSEWWLRTIGALIPGLITIWATFKIGEGLLNKKEAVIASLLLATSSFHIFYSQELRPYSLPTMFGSLSWLILITIIKSKKSSLKQTAGFSLVTWLGLFSSYIYPFVLFSQIIYLFTYFSNKLQKNTPFKDLIWASFFSCLGFIPWLPSFFTQLKTGQAVRTMLPGWDQVVSLSQQKSILITIGKFTFGRLDIQPNWFFLSFSMILVFTTFFLLANSKQKLAKFFKTTSPFLFWLGVPLIASWLISFWIPVIQPKRMMLLLPAYCLLLAALATQSFDKNSFKFWLAKFFLFLLFSLNLFSTFQYLTSPKLQREDWRSLHSEIAQKFSPQNTAVLFSYPHPFSPWVWYDSSQFPTISTGTFTVSASQELTNAIKSASSYQFILVFDYLRDLTDPQNLILSELESFGYKGIGVIDRPNIGFVRIYSKPDSTLGMIR